LDFDLIIKGASIYLGEGPAQNLDLAVKDGTIAAVGSDIVQVPLAPGAGRSAAQG